MERSNFQHETVELFPGNGKDVRVGCFMLSFPKGAVKQKSTFKLHMGNSSLGFQEPSCPGDCMKLASICCTRVVTLSKDVLVKVKTNCLPSSQDKVPVRIMQEKNGRWDPHTEVPISDTGVVDFFCQTFSVIGIFLPLSSSRNVRIPLHGSITQEPDGNHAFTLSMQGTAGNDEEKTNNQVQLYDSNAKRGKSDPELYAMLNDEVIVSYGGDEKKMLLSELSIQKFQEYLIFHGPNSGTSNAKYTVTLLRSQNSTKTTVATREYPVPESPTTNDADASTALLQDGEGDLNFCGPATVDVAIFGGDGFYVDKRGLNASDTPPSFEKAPESDPKPSHQNQRHGTTNFKDSFKAGMLIKDTTNVFMDMRTGPSKDEPGGQDLSAATDKNDQVPKENKLPSTTGQVPEVIGSHPSNVPGVQENPQKVSSMVQEAVQMQDEAVPMRREEMSQEESKDKLDDAKEVILNKERKPNEKDNQVFKENEQTPSATEQEPEVIGGHSSHGPDDTGHEVAREISGFRWRISMDLDLTHILLLAVIVALIAYICMI